MTKKYSRIKFCVIAVIAVLGLFLTFFSFNIPTTTTTFRGFFNALPLGYDVDGGSLAVYEAQKDEDITQTEFNDKFEKAIDNLSKTLSPRGYNVVKQGDNLVMLDASVFDSSSTIFDLVGSKEGVNITSDSKGEEVGITGEFIKSCTASYQATAGSWGVAIEFTEEGGTKFLDLTTKQSEAGGSIYFFVDGTQLSQVSVSEPIAGGSTFISMDTQSAAENYALQVSVTSNDIYLKEVINGKTTSVYGENFKTCIIIALALILVATFVFLIVKYGILGVLADFAFVFYAILYIFLLQAIPLVCLSLAGIIGTLISYVILLDMTIIVCNKIRQEYASGKKIPNSVMSGFKKTIRPALETHIMLLVLSFVAYVIGVKILADFAVSLFIGLFVSFFTIFVIFRGFAKLFLNIDSIHAKTYKLKREAKSNEI